jgi:hypothetical protein
MAFNIKRNDLRPYLPAQFFQPNGVDPLPLDQALAVNIVVSPKGAAPEDPPKFKKACVITDALAGQIEYRWSGTDTDTAGDFSYEFEISWPNAEPQTIPADAYLDLVIVDDLG